MTQDIIGKWRKNAGRVEPTKRELEVESAWLDCDRNTKKAAEQLGISKSTVSLTIRALRIKRDREAGLNAKGAK